CGHGEALDALYDLGFRNLSGTDISIPPELGADPRFRTQIGDARQLSHPDGSADWILNIHAMHHIGRPQDIEQFLNECYRVLKPGGRLGIVDFPNSPQIRLAFWFFRQNRFLWTPYLKYFGKLVQEEWYFLKDYLPQWPRVERLLWEGRFELVSDRRDI